MKLDNNLKQTIASLSSGGSQGRVSIGYGAALTVGDSSNTTFEGSIDGMGELIKQGSGMLTLSRANGYTGSTSITDGTLALGSNNALPTGTPVILSGGTLATDTFSQTNSLGRLTLANDSMIDMGILGSSILKFADSHSMSWAGTLTIANWSGSLDGGGADDLFFGSSDSGLTHGQLNDIVFANPNGLSGNYQARILATGEIVPVPEPATMSLLLSGGLLLAGLALPRWRRRTISA